MNAKHWVFGTTAALCWFFGSAVPAAPPAASAALTEPLATPAAATAAEAAEGESNGNQLIVVVLTKGPSGTDVPVNDASVTLFVGEESLRSVTKTDGRAKFSLPAGSSDEATLRVVAANLQPQQKKIPSLHDAAGQPQKVIMEKQDAGLVND